MHRVRPHGAFQSTPPARGATAQARPQRRGREISIHAPREGGDTTLKNAGLQAATISIHAPREGGDATPTGQAQRSPISIHAPREGGDWYSYPVEIDPRTISIHAPREGGDTTPIIMIARRI